MSPRCTLIALCLTALLAAFWGTPAFCQAQKPQLVAQAGHSDVVSSVAFSPDGSLLASGSADHTIKLWDVATGQLLRTLVGHTGSVNAVVFSHDGRTLASAGGNPANTNVDPGVDPNGAVVKTWNVATGRQILSIADGYDVYCVAFRPDGKTLVSGDDGGSLKLWDARSGALLGTLPDSARTVVSVAFSPDGKTLAAASADNTIKRWDIATRRVLNILSMDVGFDPDGPVSTAFSSDGKTVADKSNAGRVELWDLVAGEELRTLEGPTTDVNAVSFSADGTRLATGSKDKTLTIWDAETGKLLRSLAGSLKATSSVALSPDGKMLACGEGDAAIHLWDAVTGHEMPPLTGQTRRVTSVTFGPDGKTLASATQSLFSINDGMIKFWDIGADTRLHIFSEHAGPVFWLSFSPDGNSLTSGNGGKTVTLWDVPTTKAVSERDGRVWTPCFNAFSADGKLLAHCGADSGFMLEDRAHGTLGVDANIPENALALFYVGPVRVRPAPSFLYHDGGEAASTVPLLRVFTGHDYRVMCACFSPDGRILASGDEQGVIKLWDVATGRELHTLIGHTSEVNAVAFSPDGRTLASASSDTSLRLWDTATGREMGSLYDIGEAGWSVVTPEGRFDTDDLDNIKATHWVLPDQPLTPIPVEAFFAQYYTPGLLAHLLNRDPLPPLPDISQINHVQPEVAIDNIVPHSGDDAALVDVTVSYAGQEAEAIQPDGTKKTETSGVYDLRLFRDGQLVAALPEDAAPGAAPADLSQGTVGKTLTHTFTVRLAQDGAKSVPFTAYAFNGDKVKSRTAARDYAPPQPLAPVKGRAWVLAFGVDAYEDPHWDLRFAVADARAFRTQLVPRLRKTGQYSQVTFVPLVSSVGGLATDALPATKAALRAALMALAGKAPDAQATPFTSALQRLGVGRAAPEDMVLLAFSCHGDADPHTGEYYLFPADIGPDQSRGLTPDLETRAVSSAELTGWMQGVDAGEMAMVIDSCHSAAAAGEAFKPGPMDSPGLGQLAYYKRMRILSASAADAVAKEYPDLGHGLLTAALVGDGLVNGGAKPGPGQSVLTLGPWLRYAEGDVPALDARERGRAGHKEVVMVENGKAEAPDAGLQRPSLFDFHRADAPDAAVSGAAAGGVKAP